MAKNVKKTKAVAKKATKPVAKKAASKTAKPAAKKAVKPAPKKAAKPAANKVAKAAAKKVAKPAAKKVVKPAPKKVVKPVAKKATKPAAKKVSKPTPKKVVKTVAKKVAKPVAKKVVKPLAKKVAKPVAKKVVKPVAKKTVKAVAKATTKPVAKKASLVAKKEEKPLAKKNVKQAVAPMVTKPAVPKPKTVAELIEANKIPVEKNFPVTKKEMKSTKLATEAYISPAQEKPVKAPIIGKTKFNDAELAEFKQLINYKLAEAIKDYELLKDTLSHRDNNGTDDTSPTFKLLEDGSEVMSKEETTQLAIRQEKFIQNLKNALIRIENKTYGVCRATGNMISKERLRSVPHATLSIEAKRDQN
jgi:RNA polymerase-binding transcription factor DksA